MIDGLTGIDVCMVEGGDGIAMQITTPLLILKIPMRSLLNAMLNVFDRK